MLLKHPDQYTDEELEAWVRHLVDEQVSEGPRLDYKANIPLERKEQRLEAAKDISSFANEIGGTLIYGIPEDRQSDEISIPCKPYGIDPVPDLESRLENIYVDSISPRLPEWRIKKVKLTEYEGKVVYIVWTPESWLGPHMVQAYKDKRYYRRGQLRAVPMEEHEVRAKYERIRNLESTVADFLNSRQVNYISQYFPIDIHVVTHYAACPVLLSPDRVDFTAPDMRQWLVQNYYGNWQWVPSGYGVRTQLPSHGTSQDCSEIHKNGAISHWREASIAYVEESKKHYLAYMDELKEIQEFLQFAGRFYDKIQYFGPLLFQIQILNWLRHTVPPKPPLWLPRGRRWPGEDRQLITHDNHLLIRVTESSSKLFENLNLILKQIADEMFRAFGLWEADCFDEQLNLRRY